MIEGGEVAREPLPVKGDQTAHIPTRDPGVRFPGTFLVIVCGLFALCVAYGITAYPWTDEIQTRAYTQKSYGELWNSYYAHRTYALVAKATCAVFGENRVALRMPAALGGIATLIALYFLGSQIFNRNTGLIAALYLAVHAIFLQYSKEARGFSLGMLCLTLGALALWKWIEKPNFIRAVGFLAAFYLAYLFHPTMALLFPGFVGAGLIIAISKVWRGGWKIGESIRSPRTMVAIVVFLLVGVGLAFPYLKSYWNWDTLLIPEHTKTEGESFPAPFRTWGSFLYYSAPLLIAPRHWGPSLYLALVFVAVGIVGSVRKSPGSALLLALPAFAPIPFFWIVPFERIPERYLLGCLPFVSLLAARGIMVTAEWATGRFSKRAVQSISSVVLVSMLVGICVPPFAAEVLYGKKPGQHFYRPFLDLATSDPFKDWTIWFDSSGSFYQEHLKTLGLPEERILDFESGDENSFTMAKSKISAGSGLWICPTDPKRFAEMDEIYRAEDSIALDLFGMRLYFWSLDFELPEVKREWVAKTIDQSMEQLDLDYRTELSLAGLAAQYQYRTREDRLASNAIEKTKSVLLLDSPRRVHTAIDSRVQYLLAKGKTIEAANLYLEEIEQHPSLTPAFYIELFENFPKERWPFIVNLSRFHPESFSDGFLSSLEASVNLTPERRAELAHRLGNTLLHTGQFDATRKLLQFAVENGDPGGESEKLLALLDDIERNWNEDVMHQMLKE